MRFQIATPRVHTLSTYSSKEVFLAAARRGKKKAKETIVFTRQKVSSFRKQRKVAKKSPTQRARSFLKYTAILFVFLVSLGIFAAVLRGVPGNPTASEIRTNLEKRSQPFELSPERGRYAIIMALDENKSFALSAQLRDVVYPDVGYYEGRYYSFFAPGISLLAYPFYFVGKQFNIGQVASYSVISLFALLNMAIIYKICRHTFKLPYWAGLFGGIMFAFGSTSLSYANTMYQHHVTTFFILSSFYAVWKFAQKGRFSYLWAVMVWCNYALAIFIDYPNAILMFPVMVYLLIETVSIIREKRKLYLTVRLGSIITMIAFLGITAVHGYYNYVNFDSPLRVSGSLIGYKAIKDFHLLDSKKGKENLKKFEAMKQPVGFFKEENLPKGLFILLFDTDKGIFFFAPIFLIAVFDIVSLVRRIDRRYGVLLATVALNLFLYASFDDPWGGYAFGPRYLIPTMGVLSILASEFLVIGKRKLLIRGMTFLLFLYSAFIALLGALTTNSIPPKVEAIPLHSAYNFVLNYSILKRGISSSYLYNTFFNNVSLWTYFMILYGGIILLFVLTLFILPRLSNYED